MKFVIMAILALSLVGCSSTPAKVLMKNCTRLQDDFYSCEEIPSPRPVQQERHIRN